MKKVGVVGCGLMGTDIAHMISNAGFDVMCYDLSPVAQEKSCKIISDRLERYVSTGRMDEPSANEIRNRIKYLKTFEQLEGADLIIESVTEDLQIKKNVFSRLDDLCPGGTVLVSNTSSISITAIASVTHRPDSVIGLHFINPVRVMKLVEIICGLATTRETFETARSFVKKLGKDYIESRDLPGFALNRMLFPMIQEAITLLYENAAKPEQIDKTMRVGLNWPMGPLEMADLIGLDVVLAVADEMYRGYGDTKYRPHPLLRQYVSAGYLGRKTGRGFYHY